MPKITDDEPTQQLIPNTNTELGFVSLDDSEDKLNILYYGREGAGKTSHALDAAHLGRVLVINAEGGLKKQALRKRGIPTENVSVWPRPGQRIDFNSLTEVYEQIRSDLDEDPDSWAAVVIDSVTELATVLRENATQSRHDNLKQQGRTFDETFIDRGDYGVQTDQAQRLIRKFRDLPCHFIVTALERIDDETGTAGPAINPALASSVLGYVDLVLFTKSTQSSAENTEDIETEYRAATRPGSKWRAKDRFDVTPRVLAEPTFTRLLAYVEGDLTEDTDALQEEFNKRQAERDAQKAAAEEAKKTPRKATRNRKGASTRTDASEVTETPTEPPADPTES